MDYDDAIRGQIFTRRQAVLTALHASAGLAILGLFPKRTDAAATPATKPSLPLIAAPALTEGPFFVDEKLKRSDLLAGTKRASVVDGLPLLLTFTVYRLADKKVSPMKDVQVDLWHADVTGVYSDESNPMNHEDTARQSWLRGYQLTDEAGNVVFKTIIPGWYEGRAPHIHFKVRHTVDGKTLEFNSQLFLKETDAKRIYSAAPYKGRGEQETHNADDFIYSEKLSDGSVAGSHLLLDLRKHPDGKGHAASFPLILSDKSFGEHRKFEDDMPPGGFGPPPDFGGTR
jgi:protocatechuate 3,4-dioxygenase beta subunit